MSDEHDTSLPEEDWEEAADYLCQEDYYLDELYAEQERLDGNYD